MSIATVPANLKWTLSALRVRSGLSQEEAAKALGVSAVTLRLWEKDAGEIQMKDVKKITDLYHIPQKYIFFGKDFDLIEKIKEEESENE